MAHVHPFDSRTHSTNSDYNLCSESFSAPNTPFHGPPIPEEPPTQAGHAPGASQTIINICIGGMEVINCRTWNTSHSPSTHYTPVQIGELNSHPRLDSQADCVNQSCHNYRGSMGYTHDERKGSDGHRIGRLTEKAVSPVLHEASKWRHFIGVTAETLVSRLKRMLSINYDTRLWLHHLAPSQQYLIQIIRSLCPCKASAIYLSIALVIYLAWLAKQQIC